MPGLIDCHVHVFLSEVNIRNLEHDAAHPDDGARGGADARHDRSRLHHGARHRRRRLGDQDRGRVAACSRARACSSPARAIGPTGGHSDSRRRTDTGAPCSCCNAMVYRHGPGRRRRRGAQGGARADAPGRRPGEDHVLGRRRLALRPARQPAVLARRDRRGDRRGAGISAAMCWPMPTRPRRSRAR